MKKYVFYWLALCMVVIIGCQKELSFETGNAPGNGSLQADASGDCLPKTVNGVYVATTPLVPATNTITVQVNVTRTGTYVITTDTVNGYYFRATGTFTALGPVNVTLRSNGTPFTDGTDNFIVSYNGTICDIAVVVLPAGSGPAVFTLVSGGTPANCATAVVGGTYVQNVAVNASHYVDVTVNVTVLGTYTLRATGGGMIFLKAAAAFTTLGNQVVRLQASGTPTTVGANTITFDAPFASCSFTVTVGTPVTGTLGGGPGACTPVTIIGTYTQGVALTPGHTVQVQITTSAVGPYSITTNTVAGISFSASGTSNGATQTITLLNNGGTPNASGTQNFTVTFGTSTCTFSIPIGSGGSAFTLDCTTATIDPDALFEATLDLNCSNRVDVDVNVTALGPYTITTTATNGITFSATGTFTVLGVQTVTLIGSGTPVAGGTFNIPVNVTPACSFPLFVEPPTTDVGWSFRVTNAPATTYKGQEDDAIMVPAAPAVGFAFFGSNSYGLDNFQFALNDANGTIAVNETYSTSALTGNQAAFQYDLTMSPYCSDTYKADPTVSGASITFTVTSHNAVTMVISGTFTGTAKNLAGQTITITTGTFTTSFNPYHF